jgi:Tfp pilus assembly protein FimT
MKSFIAVVVVAIVAVMALTSMKSKCRSAHCEVNGFHSPSRCSLR